MKNNELAKISKSVRRSIIEMVYRSSGQHVGCALGITDILVVLYFIILRIHPKKLSDKARDRFILSKGHACTALYAVLSEKGFFSKKILSDFSKNGSPVAAHSTLGSLPGIEATAGSLGHGLPMGVGMSISLKRDYPNSRVYVLVGDGECMEGSNWEAILFAAHHKLNNLTLIIDDNGLITLGKTNDILSLQPLEAKLQAFGWSTIQVDGHNYASLTKALKSRHTQKPTAIIARTIKGKGVSYMENGKEWHGKSPDKNQYQLALSELTK